MNRSLRHTAERHLWPASTFEWWLGAHRADTSGLGALLSTQRQAHPSMAQAQASWKSLEHGEPLSEAARDDCVHF